MMRPGATLKHPAPFGALVVSTGLARQSLHDRRGNLSDTAEFRASPAGMFAPRRELGRALAHEGARPFFASSEVDHLTHLVAPVVVSSLVADDEHDAWSSHGAGKITHEGASRG